MPPPVDVPLWVLTELEVQDRRMYVQPHACRRAVRGRQCYDYTIREHAAQKLDAPASHRCQKLFTAERLGLRNIDGMVSVGKIALSGLRRLRRRLRPCAGILQAST